MIRKGIYFIAEAGVNHNGDPKIAKKLIDVAVESGADAVKFQTFKADRLVSSLARKAGYQVVSTGSAENQLDMLRGLAKSASVGSKRAASSSSLIARTGRLRCK